MGLWVGERTQFSSETWATPYLPGKAKSWLVQSVTASLYIPKSLICGEKAAFFATPRVQLLSLAVACWTNRNALPVSPF